MGLRIALVVPGRFHAFDLAKALLQRGHAVTILTDYPRWAVERFGVRGASVRTCWLHAILSRSVGRWLPDAWGMEALQHRLFGGWAARQMGNETWDLIHCWSGVSEELLHPVETSRTRVLLMRGSSHIRTQSRILQQEERRTGIRINRPSPWMLAREEREYALAPRICVLSRFAYRSFIEEGIPEEKLSLIPLAVPLETFSAAPEVVELRRRRILTGEPLRVLYVGVLSLRKGLWDMAAILRGAPKERFRFRLVGTVIPEAAGLAETLRGLAGMIPHQPQDRLKEQYAWGDLFLFPTLEDGFPIVLAQACASALPILTTGNGSGPDLLAEGKTGWILPIRSPDQFLDRLIWADIHRQELAEMVRRIFEGCRPRSWADVARDFESLWSNEDRPPGPVP